jgi:hypothetical protein
VTTCEASTESLTPIFPTCPTGYFNPCLEACHRDPTTCCYYQGPEESNPVPPKPIRKDSLDDEYHCNRCGISDPALFYPYQSGTCKKCSNAERLARYHAQNARTPKLREVTRICSQCGAKFVKLKVQTRRSKCARCRGVEGME